MVGGLLLSSGAFANENPQVLVTKPFAIVRCSHSKTAVGTVGEDAGTPDLSLHLLDSTDSNNKIGSLSFKEGDEANVKGASLSVEGHEIFIQSGTLEVNDGKQSISFEAGASTTYKLGLLSFQAQWLGFGHRENCEKFAQEFKFRL